MVEDADRVDEIEVSASRGSPEGRIVDVRLDDVRIGQVPDVFECRVDRIAQVDADHLFGTVSGREEGMPANSTAGIQDQLVLEECWFDRPDPVKKLPLVLVVHLPEMPPLPAEGPRRLLLAGRQLAWEKPGNARPDRVRLIASLAAQGSLDNLITVLPIGNQPQRPLATGAAKVIDQTRFHGRSTATAGRATGGEAATYVSYQRSKTSSVQRGLRLSLRPLRCSSSKRCT